MASISYGRQYIDNKDISSVTQSLKKEKLTTGDQVDKFEKKLKKYLKCKYALSCNSGTSALFIAYQALRTNKKSNIKKFIVLIAGLGLENFSKSLEKSWTTAFGTPVDPEVNKTRPGKYSFFNFL